PESSSSPATKRMEARHPAAWLPYLPLRTKAANPDLAAASVRRRRHWRALLFVRYYDVETEPLSLRTFEMSLPGPHLESLRVRETSHRTHRWRHPKWSSHPASASASSKRHRFEARILERTFERDLRC